MGCRLLVILTKNLSKPVGFLLLFVRYSIIMGLNTGKGALRVGEIIAVLSGKGGTGKTTVCAGLAAALAAAGRKVLCVDCDVGLRNLDIALGLADRGGPSFLDLCRGDGDFSALAPHPDYPSLFFLTAPVNCRPEQIPADAFAALLRRAGAEFDQVLLDAPAGIDAGFRLAADAADRILLVTGPDPAAIRDAARTADVLELMHKTGIRLIVNRVRPRMVSRLHLTVDDIMDQAGLPLMGIIPEDPKVPLAAAAETPLLRYSRRGAAAAACRRIAARLQGLPEPIQIR